MRTTGLKQLNTLNFRWVSRNRSKRCWRELVSIRVSLSVISVEGYGVLSVRPTGTECVESYDIADIDAIRFENSEVAKGRFALRSQGMQ